MDLSQTEVAIKQARQETDKMNDSKSQGLDGFHQKSSEGAEGGSS